MEKRQENEEESSELLPSFSPSEQSTRSPLNRSSPSESNVNVTSNDSFVHINTQQTQMVPSNAAAVTSATFHVETALVAGLNSGEDEFEEDTSMGTKITAAMSFPQRVSLDALMLPTRDDCIASTFPSINTHFLGESTAAYGNFR
jgi:hypothetical protein